LKGVKKMSDDQKRNMSADVAPDEAPPAASGGNHQARRKLIRKYGRQAFREPNPLAAVLIGVLTDMLELGMDLRDLKNRALANASLTPVEAVDLAGCATDDLLNTFKQIRCYAELIDRLSRQNNTPPAEKERLDAPQGAMALNGTPSQRQPR
jgi:hypothetical protein